MSHTTVMTVSYDGSPFAGFAAQAGQATVQGRLEDALAVALRRPVDADVRGPHRRGRARPRPGRQLPAARTRTQRLRRCSAR